MNGSEEGEEGGRKKRRRRMGGTVLFGEPLCSETVALAWGLFPYTTSDARVSADVKTIGPNSAYVPGHRRDF